MGQRIAAVLGLSVLSLLIAPSNTVRAEECVSQGRVVTERLNDNGTLRVVAHPTGFCNPWEALAQGVSAAIVEARRANNGSAAIAVLDTAK